MRRWAARQGRLVLGLVLVLGLQGMAGAAWAANFTVTGRFLFEDREWTQFGYTGTVQNLPIRFADVEVVKDQGQGSVIATGSTDGDGNFSILVTGETGTIDVYVRCLSATDNSATYHIKVVDTFTRSGGTVNLNGSTIHAIATGTVAHNTTNPTLDMGDYLIQDTTGLGVAQAFNILDDAVDGFDYLASPGGIGRYPTAGEFVVFGWDTPQGSTGSNYFWQGIFIAANQSGGDTDGWSDTVILHELGHWASDMFGNDDNPGGAHFLNDNNQDPRLSYGEGYATFYCAQVREFRAARLNLDLEPVDDHVSIYADLAIPPTLPTPGGLEFAYDFETGLDQNGIPLNQSGTANETNVTTAMWDLVDGTTTPDESPGSDDEPGDEDGSLSWDVVQNYMTSIGGAGAWITVEDFYDGWFATHGAGFMKTEVDSAFIGLAEMLFFEDAAEPDDDFGSAENATVLGFGATGGSGVKINEVDQGPFDSIEFMNTDTVAVDMTGWVIRGYRNGYAAVVYTFPAFTLQPGSQVIVEEMGAAVYDNELILYAEGVNFVWFNGDDGAATLEDDGGAAQDFVRWDNVSGSDPNTTPVPPGTGWSGTLLSAPGGQNLVRDENGTDTDTAADWSSGDPSLGAPNFAVVPRYTAYPAGDEDMVRIEASPGDLLVVQAKAPHSAGEPRIELFDSAEASLGSESGSYGLPGLAVLQFLVGGDSTFYARVSHVGQYTDYAVYDLRVFTRPVTSVLNPPMALIPRPDHTSDVADTVRLGWLNGGSYDQVHVYRDGAPIATLGGSANTFEDVVPRGSYGYSVTGELGGQETAAATGFTFAGVLSCYLDDGLEVDTSNFDLDAPWNRVSTLAADGTWSLHDSPAGVYGNNLNISATTPVPVAVDIISTLEFDHICITEADYDFGIVEISANGGNSWTELARYDMNDHPGWADGVAGPSDWVHESFLLDDYLGQTVQVRFRLETDVFVQEDGWYIDNIRISENVCDAITAVPEDGPVRPSLLQLAGPNPFRSRLGFSLRAPAGSAARVQVFDALGRLVSTVYDGAMPGDRVDLAWDGRTGSGLPAAAGFYLLRAVAADRAETRRVVKLP